MRFLRLALILALFGGFSLPHAAHAQSQYQTCVFSDPTHCYGIGPGNSGQAFTSNGSSAYPSFSSSLPGVTSVNGVTIPGTASTALTSPTTTTSGLCQESTTTAGLGQWLSCGSGSMTWPSVAGVPCYSGSDSWCTSYSASNLIPDSYVGGLAGSPTSGQFWGYNGSVQGWYTPTGSGTVGSCTAGELAYYSATGTAVTCLTLGTNFSITSATLNFSLASPGPIGGTTPAAGNFTTGGFSSGLFNCTASGCVIGSPTGGAQGANTLNMAACYVNGVACGTSGVSSLTAGQGIAVSGSTGAVTVSTNFPERTVTSSPTVLSTDMGGQINLNVSGGGTLTIPAISSTVFAAGMTLSVPNYSASTAAVSSTPTVNSGAGCSTTSGIPPGATWQLTSNGTTLDCFQTGTSGFLNTASSGTSVTPICASGLRLTVTEVTATGNLTINAPTGCTEGAGILLKISYSASIAYAWNSIYHANAANPGAIPTSSGASSGVDFFTFYDDAAHTRFDYLAGAPAF